MIMLSAEDRVQLSTQGYLVVPGVIPQSLCDDVIRVITQFLDIDLNNPASWYEKDLGHNGLVPIHQHQAVWNTRQHPAIYSLFSQLLNTEKLWVRMDRLSFKPPLRELPEQDKTHIHLDYPADKLQNLRLQGILYLTDTEENQGAFCCVPELYQQPEFLKQRKSLWFKPEELTDYQIVNVPAKAGSLILWDSRLPHSGNQNTGSAPRLAQYITMFPANTEESTVERIQLWKEKRAPEKWRGLPYQQDPEPGEPAELTELGRKLLGLDEY